MQNVKLTMHQNIDGMLRNIDKTSDIEESTQKLQVLHIIQILSLPFFYNKTHPSRCKQPSLITNPASCDVKSNVRTGR